MSHPIQPRQAAPHALVRLALIAVMSAILAVMVLASADRASAQSVTAMPYGLSRADLADRLQRKYEEQPVAGGITSNGQLLEIFASSDARSWTIIATRPDGKSTVVADGEDWSFLNKLIGQRI